MLTYIPKNTTIQSIERFIRQSIIDSDPTVAVASLISTYQLYPRNQEIINRWSGEIRDSISGKNGHATSYYALGLIYMMHKRDPMAMFKLLNSNSSMRNMSPLCLCLFARYIHELATNYSMM